METKIELIVSDMDGCLLNSKKETPKDIDEVIDQLKEKHILFGICSGRQYASIHHKMKERNDLLYIAENGGICVYQKEVLYLNALPENSIAEFVKLAQSIGCTPVLCAEKTAYVQTKDEKSLEKIRQFYHAFENVEDLSSIHEPFCKISVLDLNGSEKGCYPHFKKYQNEFEVIVSDSIWMDIVCKGQSKGNTLKIAAEKLNLDLSKAAAFGDYFNDVEMLQAVKHSYAMKNAHPDVQKIAKHIAPSNDDNGVIKTIYQIIQES